MRTSVNAPIASSINARLKANVFTFTDDECVRARAGERARIDARARSIGKTGALRL
jgi:hypothetical protein